jgi:hypothetical protein
MRPCSLRYGLRLSGIRCLNVIGYLLEEIMRPSKSKTWKILHAFYNAGIRSWLDIVYISYNKFLCLPCRRSDLDHAAGWGMLPTRPSLCWHRPLGVCCRSKPTDKQRQATQGAGRLPGLLVGPGPSVNGSRSGTRPCLESLGVPSDPVADQEGVMY